jgi:SAM-dependent methyltransferase
MKLLDIVRRVPVPAPWDEGGNIPWNDPAFSGRMLDQHLAQEHDRASRRSDIIDRHVEWIHGALLEGEPGRVLDLCCGPGLYTSRLAGLGHDCTGIDFSPASIEHALELSRETGAEVEYVLGDIRDAELGEGFDLAMLIFGELNVFPPADAVLLIRRAHDALAPGGALLLEPQRYDAVRETGESPATWYTAEGGLFSDLSHLCLEDHYWDEESRTATTRFYVVDAATGSVERHAMTAQAYMNKDYGRLLSDGGFDGGDFLDSLPGTPEDGFKELLAIVARKAT